MKWLLIATFVACWSPVIGPRPMVLVPLSVVVLFAAMISQQLIKPRLLKSRRTSVEVGSQPENTSKIGDRCPMDEARYEADVFAFMLTLLGLVGLFAVGFSLLSLVGAFVKELLKPAAVMLESVMRPLPFKWQLTGMFLILWLVVWNALAIVQWLKRK